MDIDWTSNWFYTLQPLNSDVAYIETMSLNNKANTVDLGAIPAVFSVL